MRGAGVKTYGFAEDERCITTHLENKILSLIIK